MTLQLPEQPSKTLRSLRTTKPLRDPFEHQGIAFEWEPDGMGHQVRCATVFLTGAECKFTCSMCDLWQYTLDAPTPAGAIPRQLKKGVDSILNDPQSARWIKLYNASNFFDATSIPHADLPEIAELCEPFERVIVENHPRLFQSQETQDRVLSFAHSHSGKLEVALGLESIDPIAMSLLNKNMTLEHFKNAIAFLSAHDISTRAFILLQPPGVQARDAMKECLATRGFAIEVGVRHCSIIPTRAGAGWMTAIQESGQWSPPTATQLEQTLEQCFKSDEELLASQSKPAATTTVDLWDWQSLSGHCSHCSDVRRHRLESMNLTQKLPTKNMELDCQCIIRLSES